LGTLQNFFDRPQSVWARRALFQVHLRLGVLHFDLLAGRTGRIVNDADEARGRQGGSTSHHRRGSWICREACAPHQREI
jgi:hypothetical protein